MPEVTPLTGNTLVPRVPNARFDALRFEIPEPFDATSNPEIERPVKVPTEVMLG
jgi:hypothetical protein